ncbi:hypothetical protein RB196_32145 [Streptomyces sp. PmtA]
MSFQRSGVAREQRVEVRQEKAGGFAGLSHVSPVEGLHYFSDVAAED